MQRAIRVLAVGLDYRRYARFSMLVPYVSRTLDGGRRVHPHEGLVLGEAEYQFCRQYVIDAALKLAEDDFTLDLRRLRRAAQAEQWVSSRAWEGNSLAAADNR